MPATAPANRTPSTPKASTALIVFEAKLLLTADIGMHRHVWITGRYLGAEALKKMVRGHQRELGYVR
jgi:hypothetical protein